MRAGKLDRRIIIEVRADGSPQTQDAFGEPIYSWSTFATVWAGRRDVKARERFASVTSQVVADVDTVWTCRWFPLGEQVQPDTHRVFHAGRYFNIVGVAEIGRRQGLEISTTARAEAPVG